MRVLVAHNAYVSSIPSGENSAVQRDIAMLREAGHDVRELVRSSDDATPSRLITAGMGVRAPGAASDFRALLDAGWRPDVLHVHNVFPLLTTSPLRAAIAAEVPVVQTLHNYRRSCAAGTHFRDGRICEDCGVGGTAWPALAHACYRGSRLQTVPVVLNRRLDRAVWNGVDAVIALTPYMRQRVLTGGMTAPVVVRPTAVPDPGTPSRPGRGAVFVGRLSPEKGAALLVEAWRTAALPGEQELTVVGDGPERQAVASAAAGLPGVRLTGPLPADGVAKEMRRAAVVVVPSLWYEGFPTVVAEAFAHGRPVIALDNPNMRSVVDGGGWLAAPNPDRLAATLRRVLGRPQDIRRVAAAARHRYEQEMTPEVSYELLMSAYTAAVRRRTAPLSPEAAS
jgi:glycosyltransferase involved in cell wall biosynthesis